MDNEIWGLSVSAAGYNGIVEGGQTPLAVTLTKDFQLQAAGWDWSYDSGTKTLRILGDGAMDDYTSPGNNTNTGPWGFSYGVDSHASPVGAVGAVTSTGARVQET